MTLCAWVVSSPPFPPLFTVAFNGLDPNNANLYCLPDTINVIVMNLHASIKLILVAVLKYEIKIQKGTSS